MAVHAFSFQAVLTSEERFSRECSHEIEAHKENVPNLDYSKERSGILGVSCLLSLPLLHVKKSIFHQVPSLIMLRR